MYLARRELFALLAVAGLGALAAASLAAKVFAPAAALVIAQPEITVSVAGEVSSPGSYRLPFGARVADLVAMAGGLTAAAAAELVALADPLTDGEALVVAGAAGPGGAERISLNRASSADLLRLPGVGPVLAERIVAHRPYSRIDDLLRVPGIGPRTLERLKPLVTM